MNEQIAKDVQDLIEANATIAVIKGYLAYRGISPKEIAEFLKAQGVTGNRASFIDDFRRELLKGYTSRDTLLDLIGDAKYSDNERKHISARERERIFANKLHAKYDSEASRQFNEELAEAYKTDSARGKKAPKGGNTFDSTLKQISALCGEHKSAGRTEEQLKAAKTFLSNANRIKARYKKATSDIAKEVLGNELKEILENARHSLG